MHNNNHYSVNYLQKTKDQANAQKIVEDFHNLDSPSLHWLICKFIQCQNIRSQPQFLDKLFADHLQLVIEMIQWMLTPKAIAKRKKIKSNLDFFPFRCKQFMKDNLAFYDQMYLAIRQNKLNISIWFNFLRKEYSDKQTLPTALGYFAQVMVPFAKYEFSTSSGLSRSVTLGGYQATIQNINIMKILPNYLIEQIIQFSCHQGIFQFLKTAILVCYQNTSDYEICNSTLIRILQKSQVPSIFSRFSSLTTNNAELIENEIQLLDHISHSLKQLIANIDPNSDMQIRIQYFISSLLQSNIINYAINQIIQSRLCKITKDKERQSALSSSQEIKPRNNSTQINLFSSQKIVSQKNKNNSDQNVSLEYDQQDLMQPLLRILVYSTQIFIRIPKSLPQATDTIDSIDQRQDRYTQYKQMIAKFSNQMQLILDHLEIMTRLVYKQQQPGNTTSARTIKFSSGQKIKAISYMKYKFFMLLHNCLIMTQCGQNLQNKMERFLMVQSKSRNAVRKLKSLDVPVFELNIEKLHILEIIQKYLCENRWNNIVHHLLQKICHSLIICSYDYLKKNFEIDLYKKTNETFLAFLIENFTQRHYIFLNTLKFTTQGNLQSLYNISKDFAYTLNSTNQLVIMLNEFEPWKKFIMTDLKVYEQNTYPAVTRPDDFQNQQQIQDNQVFGLKVDQVDSIRKLIQNISTTKKWPTKMTKNKGLSKSGEIKNCDEKQSNTLIKNLSNSRQYYIKQKKQKAIDDFLKKKVEYNRRFKKNIEIQQLDVEDISVREQLQRQQKQKQISGMNLAQNMMDLSNSKHMQYQNLSPESNQNCQYKESSPIKSIQLYDLFKKYSSDDKAKPQQQ